VCTSPAPWREATAQSSQTQPSRSTHVITTTIIIIIISMLDRHHIQHHLCESTIAGCPLIIFSTFPKDTFFGHI